MNSVPSVGVERAFRRELGVSFEELGDEWREDVQTRLLAAGRRRWIGRASSRSRC